MFNTNFDIRNIWTIIFIIVILVLVMYMYLKKVFKRKPRIRLNSRYTQTEPVTIVEYDMYGEPYINGYLAVLYGKPYTDIPQWNVV